MLQFKEEADIIVGSSGLHERYAKFLRTLTDAEFVERVLL